TEVQRSPGAGGGPAPGRRRLHARADREAADLRPRPRAGALRSGHGEGHCAAGGGERLSVLGPGHGDRAEPSLPHAEGRRRSVMNPIFRRHLARRTFLRGAGATLPLPLLDAMRPAFARAASVASPVRLSFAYVPNGIIMPDWKPAAEGSAYAFTRILKPLEPLREDVLVLSGLAHNNANELGDGPGDHARAAACFLTGVHAKKTAGADIHNGVSADQIVAQALAAETRLPSLELGCEESRTVGNCD